MPTRRVPEKMPASQHGEYKGRGGNFTTYAILARTTGDANATNLASTIGVCQLRGCVGEGSNVGGGGPLSGEPLDPVWLVEWCKFQARLPTNRKVPENPSRNTFLLSLPKRLASTFWTLISRESALGGCAYLSSKLLHPPRHPLSRCP